MSPVPRKSPFKSAIKGSLSDQPAAPAVRIVPGSTLKRMLERAAKARGTPISPPRPSREAADIRPAAAAVSPPLPPVLPAVPPPPVRKQRSSISTSADLPSGSGSGSCDQDEVIARFVDACPGGSSANMAGLPSDVLVTKGAALLAEVRSIDFFPFLPLLSIQKAFRGRLMVLSPTPPFFFVFRGSNLPWPRGSRSPC